jgi:hypothetical protein
MWTRHSFDVPEGPQQLGFRSLGGSGSKGLDQALLVGGERFTRAVVDIRVEEIDSLGDREFKAGFLAGPISSSSDK